MGLQSKRMSGQVLKCLRLIHQADIELIALQTKAYGTTTKWGSGFQPLVPEILMHMCKIVCPKIANPQPLCVSGLPAGLDKTFKALANW